MHKFECTHDAFVDGCPSCMELAAIERAFIEDRDALLQQAQVPSSAIVWWRAQMRSRRDAVKVAAEPITFVQGLTVACAIGVLAGAIGFFTPTFGRIYAWITGASLPAAPSLPTLPLPSVTTAIELLANPVVIAVIACIGVAAVVLPVALYFTFNEGD